MFFVLKLVVIFLFVVQGSEAFVAMPPSWLKPYTDIFYSKTVLNRKYSVNQAKVSTHTTL